MQHFSAPPARAFPARIVPVYALYALLTIAHMP
jgi:hypothetical protein